MRYIVAHLLSGDAKRYHEALSRHLALKYRIIPLHERTPPHITLKPPFETDESGVKEVERVLRSFASNEHAAPLTFSGFGRFGFRTVYLDVLKNDETVSLARRAIATLNANVPWMPHYPLEGNKLHASVARFLDRKQFRRIWRLLKGEKPRFEMMLDTIAILRKEGRVWQIHTLIPLRALDKESFSDSLSVFSNGSDSTPLYSSY